MEIGGRRSKGCLFSFVFPFMRLRWVFGSVAGRVLCFVACSVACCSIICRMCVGSGMFVLLMSLILCWRDLSHCKQCLSMTWHRASPVCCRVLSYSSFSSWERLVCILTQG